MDKALEYSIGSKERKLAFDKIRLLGKFRHNQNVFSIKEGELKVIRRPSKDDGPRPDQFFPCIYCYGFMRKDDLWKHT